MKPFDEDFSFDKYAKILKVPTPKSLVGKEVSASLKWDGDTCYLLLETPVCVSDEKTLFLVGSCIVDFSSSKTTYGAFVLEKSCIDSDSNDIASIFFEMGCYTAPYQMQSAYKDELGYIHALSLAIMSDVMLRIAKETKVKDDKLFDLARTMGFEL